MDHVERLGEVQAEALRQGERLSVELRQSNGEVVVDQLGARSGTARAAVVDGRAGLRRRGFANMRCLFDGDLEIECWDAASYLA